MTRHERKTSDDNSQVFSGSRPYRRRIPRRSAVDPEFQSTAPAWEFSLTVLTGFAGQQIGTAPQDHAATREPGRSSRDGFRIEEALSSTLLACLSRTSNRVGWQLGALVKGPRDRRRRGSFVGRIRKQLGRTATDDPPIIRVTQLASSSLAKAMWLRIGLLR